VRAAARSGPQSAGGIELCYEPFDKVASADFAHRHQLGDVRVFDRQRTNDLPVCVAAERPRYSVSRWPARMSERRPARMTSRYALAPTDSRDCTAGFSMGTPMTEPYSVHEPS
jgi:hypothetical protein